MDQQKRTLIALGLCLLLTAIYWSFFMPSTPQNRPGAVSDSADGGLRPPVSPPIPVPAQPAVAPPDDDGPPIQIERSLPLVRYVFSSRGAGLLTAELRGRKMKEQLHLTLEDGFRRLFGGKAPPAPPMDMARPIPNQFLPLAISIEGSQPLSGSVRYRPTDGSPSDPSITWNTKASNWEVSKKFEFSTEGLETTYTISLHNTGSQAATGELAITYGREVDPRAEEKPSMFGGVGNLSSAACSVGDDFQRLLPDSKPTSEFRGSINFVGIDQQYFLAAVFPSGGAKDGRCVLSASASSRAVTAYFPIQIGPGETVVEKFGVFVGPKDMELLVSVPSRLVGAIEGSIAKVSPHLEKAIDFGIWAFICRILLAILKFFHGVFGNWGVAVIGLTVLVKLVLLPLTHKSMVSAEAMKKLQPKVEELRKKYAQDKERQNLEMMKLYQEAKVNPLGGCLPMLLQMPVWFALFTTLRNTYDIYGEPFISPLWMDLTYKDPTYILPTALGVTMIVTQRLQPQVMDAAQAKVMTYVMPVLFTGFMMNYPAGLTLYIFTNNLLSIAQQYGLRKYLEGKGNVKPTEKRK